MVPMCIVPKLVSTRPPYVLPRAGYCGTFGRVGSCEGQWALRGGGLTSFSEEELIDCIGWDKDQYSYFSTRGFMRSVDYPYNESAYPDADPPIPGNPCVFDAARVVTGTANFFTFKTGGAPDEAQLVAFIHHNGPVSAGINADIFGHRSPGCDARGDCFITAAACANVSSSIDHSIVIAGYGTDAVRGDYWVRVPTATKRMRDASRTDGSWQWLPVDCPLGHVWCPSGKCVRVIDLAPTFSLRTDR